MLKMWPSKEDHIVFINDTTRNVVFSAIYVNFDYDFKSMKYAHFLSIHTCNIFACAIPF